MEAVRYTKSSIVFWEKKEREEKEEGGRDLRVDHNQNSIPPCERQRKVKSRHSSTEYLPVIAE